MARALHRDPSSLSRFERGQSHPRDLAAVVTAYESLTPAAMKLHDSRGGRRGVVIWMALRFSVLAVALLASGSNEELQADDVRWFIIGSALALTALSGTRLLTRPNRRALMFARTAIPLGIVIGIEVSYLGHAELPWTFSAGWITWIELGYFTWGTVQIQADDRELRAVYDGEHDGSEREPRGIVVDQPSAVDESIA